MVCVSRGCGGLALTTSKSFCWFDTQDFKEAILKIQSEHPNAPLIGCGFSLGAGLLCKYLGQEGDSSKLAGALCICPPWNVRRQPPLFELFSMLLVVPLKAFILKHYSVLKRDDISLYEILLTRNLREWDELFVKAYNLKSIEEYYHNASAVHVSHRITTPTLAISSLDDPICCHLGAPASNEQIGSGLCVVKTMNGGHLAFPSGDGNLGACWIDSVALEFVQAIIEKTNSNARQENSPNSKS